MVVNKRFKLQYIGGFTLIEVMVSLMIFMLFFIPILFSIQVYMKGRTTNDIRFQMASIASNKIETVKLELAEGYFNALPDLLNGEGEVILEDRIDEYKVITIITKQDNFGKIYKIVIEVLHEQYNITEKIIGYGNAIISREEGYYHEIPIDL